VKYVEPSAFADPLSMWWPENDEGMRVGNRVAVICIMPMGLGSMKQQHVGKSAASRCKPAIGVRVDDWWCGWHRPSFDHSDHLDLFLTVLRHWCAAASVFFAVTGLAHCADIAGNASIIDGDHIRQDAGSDNAARQLYCR
jgi:hypothetical protein